MDNCLASNSETGGVGCDNMTMVIIGLLHGKSKEEWYEEIAKRVANGDGPCAPPEYGKYSAFLFSGSCANNLVAEFRGPGVHHNFDDSDSGYDVDMDQKSKPFGGNQRGRIILLGDGTEVLTDSDDTEMFDHSEEDRDLASQVHKGEVTGHEDKADGVAKEGVTDAVVPKSSEGTEKKAEETDKTTEAK